ncbi:hypothetical protein PG985_011466 [Apiospora marii]|uniref:2EXR domain-containing protein n=1 Tax=Apiospora marii TaxID=335849 RepID=A0ABR1STR7_9PEZI
MQLPGEIRNMIWELSLPTDRVLVISAHGYYVHALPPPAIAWVCGESRALALRHGRPYALFDAPVPLLRYPRRLHQGPKTWTWFSPARDRVLLALMRDTENIRHVRDGLGALLLDARHLLVQSDCFYRRMAHLFHAETMMQNHVELILASFPNARTVGVVRACFNIMPLGDGDQERTGEGEERLEAPRRPLYSYRPMHSYALWKTGARIRLLSDPAHIRAVQEVQAQRTALCTCRCGSDNGSDGDGDDNGSSNRGSEKSPHLWQPPIQKPTQFSSHRNPYHRRHCHDHGLVDLWSPATPHDGTWELWRVMKIWVTARDSMTPRAGPALLPGYPNLDKLPGDRRAWIDSVADQAPHVYFAEMVFHGNGYMAASALPDCVAEAVAARGGRGEDGCGLLGGTTGLGVELLMQI